MAECKILDRPTDSHSLNFLSAKRLGDRHVICTLCLSANHFGLFRRTWCYV